MGYDSRWQQEEENVTVVGREIELLVNPAAGGGRSGRMLGEMTRELTRAGFAVTVHRTGAPGQIGLLAGELAKRGAPLVGVMGGDGSFHDAVNGLLGADGTLDTASGTTFAVVPAGTGGDFAARTLGIPSGAAAVADWLAAARPVRMDLGQLRFTHHGGQPATRLFVNIASCGISGRVDALVAGGPRWLAGRAAYFLASLRAMAGWRNQRVRVKVDGAVLYEGPALTVAVANGRSFGGGMLVAPDADHRDGALDVVVLGDLTRAQQVILSRSLYAGTHTTARDVYVARGQEVDVETAEPDVLLDVDGETPGRAPASFRVLPGALSLLGRP